MSQQGEPRTRRVRSIEEARQDANKPRRPPYSLNSERSLLGAALLSAAARDAMCEVVGPEDFYKPGHGHIAEAICDLHGAGLPVDATIVAAWINDHRSPEALAAVGGLAELVGITADCPSTTSARSYALRVRDRAVRRRLLSMAGDLTERVYADTGDDVDEIAADFRTWLERIHLPSAVAAAPGWDEFLADPHEYRWLVPWLIERRDRIMLTASEAGGKSEMMRQWAVQLSAGIHPFTWERFPPLKVLLVDCENSKPQLHRRLTALWKALHLVEGVQAPLARAAEPYNPANLQIDARTAGLNILTRNDQAIFASLIDHARPDVVLAGPIYKMMPPPKKDEDEARAFEFGTIIDRLRDRYDCAFIFEAHSPLGTDGGRHRTLRPIGTSYWLRWVDEGVGFRRDPDDEPGIHRFEVWKPRDDTRRWPRKIRRGTAWPWMAADMPVADPNDPAF